MNGFRNILVGVDLTGLRPLDSTALGGAAREVIDGAIWLARQNSARLVFLSVFNLSEEVLQHLDAEDRHHLGRTIEENACQVLDDLVVQAGAQGVQAERKLARGKAWHEIIRQVLRHGHDLVMVGTRDRTGWRRMLFGNTALKLLRRCPCPVWVVKPGFHAAPLDILAATDLKAASLAALRSALALAHLPKATLHVLHVLEYPLDRLGWTGLPDDKTLAYHERLRSAAKRTLQEQLAQVGDLRGLDVHIHLAEGDGVADVAIEQFLHEHHIDLLVMGTIGRGGLAGIFLGNTAERLLPEVQCSVLAVKPPDFQCPVPRD